MKLTSVVRVGLVVGVIGLFTLLSLRPAYAGGVVGNGTPGSCTEAALDTVLNNMGGLVTFNCGAAPKTIVLSFRKLITASTEIRGGGLITLSGGNATAHFQVFFGQTLTLKDITLRLGNGTHGAIENFGTLFVSNSQLSDNIATASGGAIENYGTATFTSVVIANNKAAQAGGGIHNDSGTVTISTSQIYGNTATNETGGGVWSNGTLTISNTVLTDNRAAAGGGGGIYNIGTLSLVQVTLEDNVATYAGSSNGGGLNHSDGVATLSQVTFQGNTSNTYGGGLYIGGGSLTASGTSFRHNEAVVGGAVSNSGRFMLTHSLVFTNTANSVGGVANGLAGVIGATDIATLINVTVSENNSSGTTSANGVQSNNGSLTLIHATVAGNRGGGGLGRGGVSNQLSLKNTIVANNTPQDCRNIVSSTGYNIASDLSCLLAQVSDKNNTNPLLGPLANNGGLSLTYMPQGNSPAVDGAPCVAGVTTDQRNGARPFGAACDVGAVEVGAAPSPSPGVYLPLVIK